MLLALTASDQPLHTFRRCARIETNVRQHRRVPRPQRYGSRQPHKPSVDGITPPGSCCCITRRLLELQQRFPHIHTIPKSARVI